MYKKIYFMGVKGVGMATLAVLAHEAGFVVGGSDIPEEFITDKILKNNGIDVQTGFKTENVDSFFAGLSPAECLFIATGAHQGFDNVEAVYAREKGIKVISHGEAVGLFMEGGILGRRDLEGISIAGAHGKTTVSGMLATVLSLAGYDPSYTVGTSEIVPIGAAGHYGRGKYFVAEADEYLAEGNYARTAKFLYQKPTSLLINNIDFDHPDFYKDIEAVKSAFQEFAAGLPSSGLLVVNGDDSNIADILTKIGFGPRVITFGTGTNNEFVLSAYHQNGFSSRFKVSCKDTEIGVFELSVPGYHNAKNAAGVIALALELGVAVDKIKDGLVKFAGVARRMERIGETKNGQPIIDDYAHHPEEIKKTLEAITAAYPDKKIVVVFQFHTFSRTRALFSDFVASFSDAREVIIIPTFESLRGETSEENFDEKIVSEFQKINKQATLLDTHDNVVEYINRNITTEDAVVVTMGAGNVYKVGQILAKK